MPRRRLTLDKMTTALQAIQRAGVRIARIDIRADGMTIIAAGNNAAIDLPEDRPDMDQLVRESLGQHQPKPSRSSRKV